MSESLPPPPPTNLAPPPGYAAYEGTERPPRRIGGLAKALMILLGVAALGQLVTVLTAGQALDAARDYLRTRDEDAFTDDLALNSFGSLLGGIAGVAIVVLSMIWLYRVASNHRSLARQLTWGPGWAIGSWFLPPLLFVIPLLMIRESWKASASDVPAGSAQWRERTDENPYVWVWFVLYSLVPIVLLIFGASQVWGTVSRNPDDLAEYIDDQIGVIVMQGIAAVFAAVAWGLVVRSITQRHTKLTGEAAR